MSAQEDGRSRQLYLDRQARYNSSLKGKARYQRYEEKHPERKGNWSPIMHAKARDRG